uniref:AAA+ ATPase domain-containing protein n=1 Tax=Bicosoecida sp. CB-2014 TaxID=1486930 RepID=A0A7S1GC57_9STRA
MSGKEEDVDMGGAAAGGAGESKDGGKKKDKKGKKGKKGDYKDDSSDDEAPQIALDEGDIKLLQSYGAGPYTSKIKVLEKDVVELQKSVSKLVGVKESDTGLSNPSNWDLVSDKQLLQEERPLQVARCTKILEADTDDAKYMINLKQFAKFVVALGDKVAPTDIEEGMRVGVDRQKYSIQLPLPPKIDPSVTMMTVEEKPDVTYDMVGGAGEALEKLREVVELPLLHPEMFVKLGIDPPKGVLLYGPPGTGKTLSARAVANRTDACFIRAIGSELVQKYVGEGARMVRELFTMARSKKACIVFFDEVDAIGGSRFAEASGDNEVQRTMLEIVTQLDGFDPRGNIKVLMATNRPDTLDPALLRPGRLDRKVEFGLPDLAGRTHILRIHTKRMNVDRGIRYELLARLCPSTTGAELRSVCTEAGMFAIRNRRKSVSERDFIDSINKVIKSYKKFSSTPKYLVYN